MCAYDHLAPNRSAENHRGRESACEHDNECTIDASGEGGGGGKARAFAREREIHTSMNIHTYAHTRKHTHLSPIVPTANKTGARAARSP